VLGGDASLPRVGCRSVVTAAESGGRVRFASDAGVSASAESRRVKAPEPLVAEQ
jgi:hypothetical protein